MPSRTPEGRPFFSLTQQEKCQQIRQSNISDKGTFVIFYASRRCKVEPGRPKAVAKVDGRRAGWMEALKHLGVVVAPEEVDRAASSVFANGLPDDDGQVIRMLFQHFRRPKTP